MLKGCHDYICGRLPWLHVPMIKNACTHTYMYYVPFAEGLPWLCAEVAPCPHNKTTCAEGALLITCEQLKLHLTNIPLILPSNDRVIPTTFVHYTVSILTCACMEGSWH